MFDAQNLILTFRYGREIVHHLLKWEREKYNWMKMRKYSAVDANVIMALLNFGWCAMQSFDAFTISPKNARYV